MPFQRKTFGNKPNATNVAANATAQSKVFRPKVENCKVDYDAVNDKEFYTVNVNFIHPEDISEIINQWKSQLGNESAIIKILPNQKNKYAITLKFPVELKTSFVEKYAPILTNILLSFQGKYNPVEARNIGSNIANELDSAVTKEDETNMNNSIGSNWKEMLSKLNDPDIRKKLLTYSLSSDYNKKYGKVISTKNVAKVLAQKPDASFVTDAKTWKSYNRIVNPNAQRIIITKVAGDNFTMKELNKAAVQCGYKDFKDAKAQSGAGKFGTAQQSVNQVMFNIRAKAADNRGGQPYFYKSIVYDVSDTTVIPGCDDAWAQMVGLSDNLRGVLNPSAAAQAAQEKQDKAQAQANVDPNDAAKEAKLKQYANGLTKLVPGFNPANYSDAGTAIVHAAQDYALAQCPKYNVLEDKNKRRICGAVSLAVAATLEIKVNVMNSWFQQRYSDITEKDAIIAYNIYSNMLNYITTRNVSESKNMMNESGIMSKEGFFNALQSMGMNIVKDEPQEANDGMEPTVESKNQEAKKTIKESFDSMMDRMNKVVIW